MKLQWNGILNNLPWSFFSSGRSPSLSVVVSIGNDDDVVSIEKDNECVSVICDAADVSAVEKDTEVTEKKM